MADRGKFFYLGARYRARRDFVQGSAFLRGDILVFQGDLFSPHDEAQSYEFRCEADGSSKHWLLYESDSLDLRDELFERL